MHSVHPRAHPVPAGLSDEDFGVWPAWPKYPTVYFVPCSLQRGLLYLPLLFHELGHLLYLLHRPEMDDLVRDLQVRLGILLAPSSQRNDSWASADADRRSAIVDRWYRWAQELFCDAVGYVLGGPAFAKAFSMYLRMRGRRQYRLRREELMQTEHPLTWLRVRLLADRVRRMGHDGVADSLEDSWAIIAAGMGIEEEENHGFYSTEFLEPIRDTITLMLIEANPRRFRRQEIEDLEAEPSPYTPVHLLNKAWKQFQENPLDYPSWEEGAVSDFLARDLPA